MAILGLTTTLFPKPLSVVECCTSRTKLNSKVRNQTKRGSIGNFEHMFGAVKKDWEFLKNKISKSVQLVNENSHVSKILKNVDDTVWLRNLEDPNSPPSQPISWPQPSYPALSGMDLLTADLQALAVYGSYFYSMSKTWSRPLPEIYDAEVVSNYFNCRPHIIAFRLLEVFTAFSSAVIKIRASRIRGFINSRSDVDKNTNSSQYEFGKILKETMLNLGPTFIKVGQSLSTRPDIIGSEISKALSELHDQIPPFPRAIAMKIVEDEFGAPVSRIFSYISDEPVAAASFGQVYKGTTFEGSAVAIKVQRPNLHHIVARDIYILRLGLGLLQKIAKRRNDIRLYGDELGKGLIGELDYRLEAANASRFLELENALGEVEFNEGIPDIKFSKVILNKRRGFQWQRLVLFLRVGAARKRVPKFLESPNHALARSSSGVNDIFDVATFVLQLLPSKDGIVLRRLLMTADGTTLLKAYLSEEAGTVRQQLCRAIADVLYQWMAGFIGQDLCATASCHSFAANCNYRLLLTDRRLKVVFKKVLNDARRDWLLMLRFCWTSIGMFVFASAMACHQLIISLSEAYMSRISFSRVQIMAST